MKYLECVIQESTRMFPVANIVSRDVKVDTTINGILFKKGKQINLNIYNGI